MVGKYVFDSSTIILLAKITALRSFSKTKETIITKTITQEVFEKKESEDAVIIKQLIEEKIITDIKKDIEAKKIAKDFGIEAGEAEALAFAWKEKDIVATDDFRAIKACKALDIKFVTAVHCLLSLHKNRIVETTIALEKLKKLEKHGRYSATIIKDAEQMIKGEKNG